MISLLVVDNPGSWPLDIPTAHIVAARDYLLDGNYSSMRRAKVFNLCRSYRYQSSGYYVSLLAAARGHRPLPNVSTIQDLKSQTIIRFVSDELDELIQKNLAHIRSEKFVLSIYFGRNVAKRYDRLCSHLFNLFQAPLLRAYFAYDGESWQLQNINPIPGSEVPEEHRQFAVEAALQYLAGRRVTPSSRVNTRFDLAILYDSDEKHSPSNDRAIRKFVRAAESLDFSVELITRDDYSRLAEFDALFIRDTTSVNHYTYRFSQRAAAEGLVVIDDPDSILKCTNKVYLAELLSRHNISAPKTFVISRSNLDRVIPQLEFPCIVKQPDSSFSQGVSKVDDKQALEAEAGRLLERSELIIAQEFLPTPFDWRVGIIDQKPIYASKYFMARKHWQIIKNEKGESSVGKVETLAVGDAPGEIIRTALKAANLIGDGLYGVDIKEVNGKGYVVEVNDNPSIDAGYEDTVLKDELYRIIMSSLLKRIERKKKGTP